MEKEFSITNAAGLHARPAAKLTAFAKNYPQLITLSKGEKSAPAHSLIRILGLGIIKGDTVRISVEGDNAERVLDEFTAFLANLADEE